MANTISLRLSTSPEITFNSDSTVHDNRKRNVKNGEVYCDNYQTASHHIVYRTADDLSQFTHLKQSIWEKS